LSSRPPRFVVAASSSRRVLVVSASHIM
jgi:hypothetical protein